MFLCTNQIFHHCFCPGKFDELQALLGSAFDAQANLQELMGQNKARYKERMKEKLEKRRQRLKEGMSKDEVTKLEAEEDQQFEEELKKEANVNPLVNLMVSSFSCL